MDDSGLIKIGPAGNRKGNVWDEKGKNKIVQIFISHTDEINSIQFQYARENGTLVLSGRHGSTSTYGGKFDVKLNYPLEYITWISGRTHYSNTLRGSNCYDRYNHLCSITFGTNHGVYGPFGQFTHNDAEFTFGVGGRDQLGGFHGTCDEAGIKSIGVYLKPSTTLDQSSINTTSTTVQPKREGQSSGS